MTTKLRLTILSVITFGSICILMTSLTALFSTSLAWYELAVAVGLFGFGGYGLWCAFYHVITGNEFK